MADNFGQNFGPYMNTYTVLSSGQPVINVPNGTMTMVITPSNGIIPTGLGINAGLGIAGNVGRDQSRGRKDQVSETSVYIKWSAVELAGFREKQVCAHFLPPNVTLTFRTLRTKFDESVANSASANSISNIPTGATPLST